MYFQKAKDVQNFVLVVYVKKYPLFSLKRYNNFTGTEFHSLHVVYVALVYGGDAAEVVVVPGTRITQHENSFCMRERAAELKKPKTISFSSLSPWVLLLPVGLHHVLPHPLGGARHRREHAVDHGLEGPAGEEQKKYNSNSQKCQ